MSLRSKENVLAATGEFGERVLADHVTTQQTHRRVRLRRLLSQNGAGEDGVEA